jgi:hypothetical protein
MSLITLIEIKKNAPIEKEFKDSDLIMFKDAIESSYFSSCLGVDFYQQLKSDLKDEKNWQTVKQWTAGTYNENDLVIFDFEVLRSKENSNQEKPDPTSAKWEKAMKFKEDIHNQIWDTYLKFIIACLIVNKALPFATYRIGANGATFVQNGDRVAVPAKELQVVQTHLENFHDDHNAAMIRWVISKKDETKFATISFIKDLCESCASGMNSGTQDDRIAFLN